MESPVNKAAVPEPSLGGSARNLGLKVTRMRMKTRINPWSVKSFIILPLLLLLLALPLGAQTITTKTLDRGSGGDTGQYTSQAIVNGNPAIAYYNLTDGNLMFARNGAADGSGTWTITIVDSNITLGQYTSLAVVNGSPAITYYNQTNGDLKYVRALDASGTSWDTPVTLDSTGVVGLYTSLAVVNGNPAISYGGNFAQIGRAHV